jgi:formamidopyrimidine-DNA glycosylase
MPAGGHVPELPEVETVRRALEIGLEGRRVTAVDGRPVMMRRPLDVERIAERSGGRIFRRARRRGKFLLLDLDRPGSLLIHLGMSGRLMLCETSEPTPDHSHLVLSLSDGRELRFVDPRRFGLAVWLEPGEEELDPSLASLGIEPLDPALEELLPPLLKTRRSPLKSLILDQRLVAGVGNIYAAEALWRAGIRPTRTGNRTSLTRLRRLAVETRTVIEEAVAQGGTTIRDYATPAGDFGYFAVKLQVYGKGGEPCPNCGTELKDTRIAGRTTVWCPRCQR